MRFRSLFKPLGYTDVWFAWHPVFVESIKQWVWLERLKRTKYKNRYALYAMWEYELCSK